MKKLVLFSLSGVLLLSGCARSYVITLNNGTQVTSTGKPHRDGASYVFKDEFGNKRRISAGSVSEIAPADMAEKPSDKYRFNSSK